MKLITARVRMFRHILDSEVVAIQPDVTCLVGKNESGKTAFLQALQRLNPERSTPEISAAKQYPAWLEKKHRRTSNLDDFEFVSADFEIEHRDRDALEEAFGKGILTSDTLTLSRRYDGSRRFDFGYDEAVAISTIMTTASTGLASRHDAPRDLAGFDRLVSTLQGEVDNPGAEADRTDLVQARKTLLADASTVAEAVRDALDQLTPRFFYFADYSSLPGTIRIRELLEADRSTLSDDELTALSLLQLAGADGEYLLEPDYDVRKRELENVANALTEDILDYWTTNKQIRVEIDITQRTVETRKNVQTPQGYATMASTSTVLDELRIRLRDDRHSLSLPFSERSSGFRWFFSFLAAFSAYEDSDTPLIILLDEPGLGLHARAQKDFLTFIDERLGRKRQVIYSTHSPFMVQTSHLDRVRLVEDKGKDLGSKITADVLATDSDTLFPLQSALGYDIAQHLFIAPHNLIVEGTSDLTYMVTLSRHLIELGREGLNEAWSIVPVGGADMVPTFVALLGHHLDVTVVVDSQKAGHQRLERLAEQGLLAKSRIVTIGQVIGGKLADVEDLFAIEDFAMLYNAAFGAKLKVGDLKGGDPVLARIERVTGSKFDHGKPADVFLRRRDEFLPKLKPETLERFETLFRTVNATFSKT